MEIEQQDTRSEQKKTFTGKIIAGMALFLVGSLLGSMMAIFWVAYEPSFLPSPPLLNPQPQISREPISWNFDDESMAHKAVPLIAGEASKAVVRIDTFRQAPGPRGGLQQAGFGSGFIISSDGYIVTNTHVIENAQKVTVTFKSGESFDASVVGQDAISDIAMVKVNARNLPYLEFADSDEVMVGETVIAIGNPFGYDYTVTSGVVSAIQRDINPPPRDTVQPDSSNIPNFPDIFDLFPWGVPRTPPQPQQPQQPRYNIPMVGIIQTDAAINPGNSGGPLMNLEGKVIGVNFLIDAQGQGIGFAVSSNIANKVAQDLKLYGVVSWASLGVVITDNSELLQEEWGLNTSEGIVIVEVPAGRARDAGLQKNDVILKFEGESIEQGESLITKIRRKSVGEVVTITVDRFGKIKDIPVELGELRR